MASGLVSRAIFSTQLRRCLFLLSGTDTSRCSIVFCVSVELMYLQSVVDISDVRWLYLNLILTSDRMAESSCRILVRGGSAQASAQKMKPVHYADAAVLYPLTPLHIIVAFWYCLSHEYGATSGSVHEPRMESDSA